MPAAQLVRNRREGKPLSGRVADDSKNGNIGRKFNHKEQIAKPRVKFQQARRSTRGLPAKLRLRFYGKACRSAFSRISPSAFAAAQVGPTPGMARNRVGPFGSTSRKASTMTSASREPT